MEARLKLFLVFHLLHVHPFNLLLECWFYYYLDVEGELGGIFLIFLSEF